MAASPLRDESILRWRQELRAAGLKCTQQRLAVLCELEAAEGPLSNHELQQRLAQFHTDSATTFRNLRDLCEAGMVVRVNVGDRSWRYELRDRGAHQRGRHPHFLCLVCGRVVCLSDVRVADLTGHLKIPGGVHVIEEMLLKGRCSKCTFPPRSVLETDSRD